ncbi:GNAT family N-acetyltransferase [Leucobacter insecticola]|uniref:GNAT family N-acetyltransferase n=1 Tax=Leucobacter insecticola TaxID=2714934 RepID=A0A6G8FKT0_9MICO|nr:GNAT family N-acetyltransferase [Leucobacter insecticola]QIM16682.1 GNAT family N-acetyltransferase [Leucobacter insecticola]
MNTAEGIRYRPIRAHEVSQLESFLYLAIFQPDPENIIPREVVKGPTISVYIDDWGREDDLCIVADHDGEIVGAAWTRILAGNPRGFGNIDRHTPEFSIAVVPEQRGRGIGAQLIRTVLDQLRDRGYARASLSVQKANPALRLYRRLGFTEFADHGDDYVLVHSLKIQE